MPSCHILKIQDLISNTRNTPFSELTSTKIFQRHVHEKHQENLLPNHCSIQSHIIVIGKFTWAILMKWKPPKKVPLVSYNPTRMKKQWDSFQTIESQNSHLDLNNVSPKETDLLISHIKRNTTLKQRCLMIKPRWHWITKKERTKDIASESTYWDGFSSSSSVILRTSKSESPKEQLLLVIKGLPLYIRLWFILHIIMIR